MDPWASDAHGDAHNYSYLHHSNSDYDPSIHDLYHYSLRLYHIIDFHLALGNLNDSHHLGWIESLPSRYTVLQILFPQNLFSRLP